MVETYSVAIGKGGVGKTTIVINGVYRMAQLGKRGLLIDMDIMPSATARFEIPANYLDDDGLIKDEHTVLEFFKEGAGNPKPIKVDENIDLIAGSKRLNELVETVKNGMQRNYLLSWYYKNIEWIESNYDFIWIDNHNDLSIFVDNTIAIADVVVIPIDVDLDSMERLSKVVEHVEYLKKTMVEPISGTSYVNANTVKLGNMVEYNTSDSHAFVSAFNTLAEEDDSYLGVIYRRAALKATKSQNKPLTKVQEESNKNDTGLNKFFEDTWSIYDKMFEFAKK